MFRSFCSCLSFHFGRVWLYLSLLAQLLSGFNASVWTAGIRYNSHIQLLSMAKTNSKTQTAFLHCPHNSPKRLEVRTTIKQLSMDGNTNGSIINQHQTRFIAIQPHTHSFITKRTYRIAEFITTNTKNATKVRITMKQAKTNGETVTNSTNA